MEQYTHLLISSDPDFVPDAAAILSFFRCLESKHAFRLVVRLPFEPGIVVLSPSEEPRVARNVFTGEEMTLTGFDRKVLGTLEELPAAIDGLAHYTVFGSGEWRGSESPIKLLTVDRIPFAGDPICSIQCAVRPKAVCTSEYEGAGPDGDESFYVDQPESPVQSLGVYANPWNGARMEVPGAGCARFWVAFEFGKWLFPSLDSGFDLLKPELVADAEDCFGVGLLQAGMGL